MKNPIILLFVFIIAGNLFAQPPKGKQFGFGLILGDPTGLTIKYWINRENAIDASIGGSYFGSPRIDGDYLWHFNAFQSRIVMLYAGPGLVLGFGNGGNGWWYNEKGHGRFYYRENSGAGLAVRGIFGVNVVPNRTPLEIFFEFGPLIGVAPDFGSAIDVAIGIRFYP